MALQPERPTLGESPDAEQGDVDCMTLANYIIFSWINTTKKTIVKVCPAFIHKTSLL
jgi:hypothetical protein